MKRRDINKIFGYIFVSFLFVIYLIPVFLIGSDGKPFSQDAGLKLLNNFNPEDYDQKSQNWSIVQDKRGIMYVGNHGGVLEFDGAHFHLIRVPNVTVRSLAVDDNGTVFIGGIDEIGFLAQRKPRFGGPFRYISLKNLLPKKTRQFSNVWKTYATRQGIYFQSNELLMRWNPNSIERYEIKTWEPKGKFFFSFYSAGNLFIRENCRGLLKINNDSLEPVPGGEIFKNKSIYMMSPYDDNATSHLIGSRKDGFFLYDGQEFKPFPTEVDDYLKEHRFYYGIRLSNGDFALATLRGGLVLMDRMGRKKAIYTSTDGLASDNIKYIYSDRWNNLWLCMEKGISKIEYGSPLTFFDRRHRLQGITLSTTEHRNRLYAGTTWGLYFLENRRDFQIIKQMTSPCWYLLSTGDTLLAATSKGVLQVNVHQTDDKPSSHRFQLVTKDKTYHLLQSGRDNNRVFAATSTGLISLRREIYNNVYRWNLEHSFPTIKIELKTIAEDNNGDLWLGTLTSGVIKVEFADNNIKKPVVSKFTTTHQLPPAEINVFFAAGHIMFATRRGIYRFDTHHRLFVPDTTFGKRFAGGAQGVFRIAEDEDGTIWLHSLSETYRFSKLPGKGYLLEPSVCQRIPTGQVNSIYTGNDGTVTWFAGVKGLFRFDKRTSRNYRESFRVLIREVKDGADNIIFRDADYNIGTTVSIPKLSYGSRNLSFEYVAPFFVGEFKTRYRHILEGYDPAWSQWEKEVKKNYTNLSPGSYTFRVRAVNAYGRESSESSVHFFIKPPWYRTWWALIIYGSALFLTVFLFVQWRSVKLEREKRRLERTVNTRTRQLDEKNRQLENQTLLLKEQSGKLQEMDRIKSRFFANISHEFRTPLTLIMGPLEQMLNESRDDHRKKRLNIMLHNTRRLLILINRLLDLSRFDSGKMRLKASRRDIASFLEEILSNFNLLARQKQQELRFEFEEEEFLLYFDTEKLEEAIGNLLVNAVKFTPPGGSITVCLRTTTKKTDRFPCGFLEISVKDTGIGIPQEQLVHIFDRFYNVEAHREAGVTGTRGTGIGLSLVKELISLHRGKIDVHSRVGENSGTEFIISLPMGKSHLEPGEIVEEFVEPGIIFEPVKPQYLEGIDAFDTEADDNESIKNDTREPDATQALKNERNTILVVEDNREVRTYIRESLIADYSVEEAGDGKEGLSKAQSLVPDLIISDIMMPETDGYHLCDAIKKDIKTSHIPVILLTAKTSESSIIKGLETGADDYITKPFNPRILQTRIKNLIELRSQMQTAFQRRQMLLPHEITVSSIDEAFLKEMQEIVEFNLSDPDFNVDVLSKKLLIGRSTLFKKVRALTGETPNQFIQTYRLHRGAQLLRDNFGNVTEVAFEVGFSSTAYFTKCFKEKFHQLPSGYQASESRS